MTGTRETHAAASLSNMPTEIVSEVCSSLHKEDLKSLRLSCHRLDEITQSILFDKVVVTSMDDNAGLFECVVDNPHLAQHVKTLVFDFPRFQDVNAAYYIQYLVQQVEHDVACHLQTPEPLKKKLEDLNWFKDPGSTSGREIALAVFKQDLTHGYETYIAMRNKQEQCIDTSLPQCVAVAFTKCVNVQQMEVQTEWQVYHQPIDDTLESLLPRFLSSGFVARRYNPLFLRPSLPMQESPSHEQLLSQLFESTNRVTQFKLGKGFVIPMDGLDSAKSPCFQHLTNLTLWTSTSFPATAPFLVDCLAPALRNARKLKHLQLGACNSTKYEHRNTYRLRLFPLLQGCVWPDLVTLKLTGIAASVKEFLTLFKSHKGLTSLFLTSMDIIVDDPRASGREEYVAKMNRDLVHLVWNMRRLMSLTEFSIEPPFRMHTDVYEWGSSVEAMPEVIPEWQRIVLCPAVMNGTSSIPGIYDFEEES
ncbi:MAG: hypothetical protein L6R38_008447 [Xanthoria sp. 2 TBL-2021]|nr:MAG: hypothetical protein L6R38_008447 [Xanthoria sp. 2 TBL-2021]